MPKGEELLVAAWAAVSTYENKLRRMKLPFQTFMLMEENWLTNLIIPSMVFISNKLEDFAEVKFDLVMDLDDESAIDMGRSNHRHAVNCFGAMIGLEQVNELVAIPSKEIRYDLCIIPWSSKAFEFIDSIKTKVNVTTSTFDSAKIFCGTRSVATYLAACENKAVLELYNLTEYPKEFLSKHSNPRYSMLCGEGIESFDSNLHIVYRVLERMIRAL
jgi:hypothetical protein